MADQKPYHLRNIDVENLDLSKHEKDFTPEELAAVKQALIATKNEHVANYEELPITDKAGIYAQEKFGDLKNYVEQNPESLVLAPLAVAGAKKTADVVGSIFGSLREKMAAPLPDDSLLAEQKRTQAKAPSAPENPTVPLNTPVVPKDMEIVKKSEQNKLKNELSKQKTIGVNPFEGATELRTGTGKPAYEGMNPEGKLRSTYNSIKDVPKGLAFIPNAQYIDVLRTDLGQPTYTKSFTGREFPTQYMGAPEAAVETAKGINRSLGRETRESLLARGVPKSELPNVTPGILERIGGPKGSKIVNIGGAVGALTAIPNLANAAQGAGEKDIQKTFGSLVQGVGQFLGPLGAIGSEVFGISPEELETLRKSKQSPKIGVPPPAR